MLSFIQQHPLLTAVNGAYLIAAAVGVVVTGNLEFAFYLITLLVLIAVVLVVRHRTGLTDGSLRQRRWGNAGRCGAPYRLVLQRDRGAAGGRGAVIPESWLWRLFRWKPQPWRLEAVEIYSLDSGGSVRTLTASTVSDREERLEGDAAP